MCYSPPASMVYPDTGIYCPFSAVAGGMDVTCPAGTQHCCEPPSTGTSECAPIAAMCAEGDTDWQCEGTPDCAGQPGTICCGSGRLETQAPQPGCGPDGGTVPSYTYVSGFTGSTCMTPAACTAFQICGSQADCTTGTCTPIKPKGNDIGYCAQ
jgi:hypothetical protein